MTLIYWLKRKYHNVAQYYVTLNMGEALQCIDGANCVNLINSPQSYLRLENHSGRRSSPSYYRIMLLPEISHLQYAIVTNMVFKKGAKIKS